MIYFIEGKSDKRIKIGTTVRLSHRLRQLAREFGDELTVLAVADGSFDQERELHQRFAHLRAVGEWFEPGDDLLGFIVKEGHPWDESSEERTKPVRLDFTESMHYKLRVVAAKAGMSMAVYCRLLVEKAVLEAWEKEERGR